MSDSKVINTRHYGNLLRNEIQCLNLSIDNHKTTYIKIVITGSTNLDEFKNLLKSIFMHTKATNLAGFIIQPSYGVDEPTVERLFNFYDIVYPMYQDVRIIPQLHKATGQRSAPWGAVIGMSRGGRRHAGIVSVAHPAAPSKALGSISNSKTAI